MSEMKIAMAVEQVAKIISGAPFPSRASLSKARKVVESLEVARAPQWQPIETAPKDGRPVLVTASHITGPNGEPVVWAAVFVQKLGRWVSTWDGEPLNDATHWQPLPAPPEVK